MVAHPKIPKHPKIPTICAPLSFRTQQVFHQVRCAPALDVVVAQLALGVGTPGEAVAKACRGAENTGGVVAVFWLRNHHGARQAFRRCGCQECANGGGCFLYFFFCAPEGSCSAVGQVAGDGTAVLLSWMRFQSSFGRHNSEKEETLQLQQGSVNIYIKQFRINGPHSTSTANGLQHLSLHALETVYNVQVCITCLS